MNRTWSADVTDAVTRSKQVLRFSLASGSVRVARSGAEERNEEEGKEGPQRERPQRDRRLRSPTLADGRHRARDRRRRVQARRAGSDLGPRDPLLVEQS